MIKIRKMIIRKSQLKELSYFLEIPPPKGNLEGRQNNQILVLGNVSLLMKTLFLCDNTYS